MKLFLLTITALIVSFSACRAADYDVIIRHGTIVDGTGKPGFTGDVAIHNGKIAAVGTVEGSAEAAAADCEAAVGAGRGSRSLIGSGGVARCGLRGGCGDISRA